LSLAVVQHSVGWLPQGLACMQMVKDCWALCAMLLCYMPVSVADGAAAQAEQALRTFHNSLPAAASWLLSLGPAAMAAEGAATVEAAGPAGAEAPAVARPDQAHAQMGPAATAEGVGAGVAGSARWEANRPQPAAQQQQQESDQDSLPGLGTSSGSEDEDEGSSRRAGFELLAALAQGDSTDDEDPPGLTSD
jgi:hypothetical protein